MSSTMRTVLAAHDAFGRQPIRFLLVGDSLAVTMAVGLAQASVPDYGVRLTDSGVIGCDMDTTPAWWSGLLVTPTSACLHWRSLWAERVRQNRPEVVGLLIGRWAVCDHLVGGQVMHVGQPAWDAHLASELDQAVGILSAGGAKVVFFTLPYFDPPQEEPNGNLYPENEPGRVTEYNQILTSVAARHRKTVTVIDLNRILDPNGQYIATIGNVTVRRPDGIHITAAGGEWLQPRVLPTVASLGLVARGVTSPASQD